MNTKIHESTYITNVRKGTIFEVPSKEAIETLFPNWEYEKEKVVFTCGHDDDLVAGAGILIDQLTKKYGADVHSMVSTDASNGFEPSKILATYPEILKKPEMFELLKNIGINNQDIPLEDIISKLNKDHVFKQEVSKIIHKNMIDIRKKEAINSYEILGIPKENIHYFTTDNKTIGDLCMKPYMALEMPDGKEGLYGWMIRTFREIGATRVLSINPGDTHHDHYDTAIATLDMSQRSKSNLYHIGGKGAPIKNNDNGTHGLYYLTYETMVDGMGTEYKNKLVPTLGVIGSEESVETKRKALNAFPSQGGLVSVFDKMPDNHCEFFEYFPSKDRLIKEKNDYHTAHLELLEKNNNI